MISNNTKEAMVFDDDIIAIAQSNAELLKNQFETAFEAVIKESKDQSPEYIDSLLDCLRAYRQ